MTDALILVALGVASLALVVVLSRAAHVLLKRPGRLLAGSLVTT